MFMRSEVTSKQPGFRVDTSESTHYVPCDVAGQLTTDDGDSLGAELLAHVRPYVSGVVYEVERVVGFFGRFSAPGYLDATDWDFSTSRDELVAWLDEMYVDLGAEECDE